MKRLSLLITIFLSVQIATAQNPRAVFKSLAENDIAASTEHFEKINDKTTEKMPEMCHLAKAALFNMPKQPGSNKIEGYKILAKHINEIRSSENAEKVFHKLDISLSDVITNIENESCNYVIKQDNEELYVSYIALAQQAGHHRLSEIEQHLERCRYNAIMERATIAKCNFFLDTYPQSAYHDEVATVLMNLHYDEAMKSDNEGVVETFMATYPNHTNIDLAANHLMGLRYKRIFSTKNLNDMKWFVELYPDHSNMTEIKQTMADIEYPTLEDSREALAQFIEYYPTTSYVADAQQRIDIFDILECGDFNKFVRYYVRNGYDANFYALQCSVAKINGYVILSNNIDKLALIRFANSEGKVGYCDLEGNIILEPQFDSKFEKFFYQKSTNDLEECTTERGLAIVSYGGKQGVINTKGEYLIEPKYHQVAFWNDGIAAIKSVKLHTTVEWEWAEHFYTLFDYNGAVKLENQTMESDSDFMGYPDWDTSWFTCNATFEDTSEEYIKRLYTDYEYIGRVYGGLHSLSDDYKMFTRDGEGKTCFIDRAGNTISAEVNINDTECLYDNVIKSELSSSWKSVIIDLDARKYLSQNEYKKVISMSEGMILVFHHDETIGFITKELKPAFEQRFKRAYNFYNGSAAVYKDNSWYLINKKGEQISANYDDLHPIPDCEGLYAVMLGDKYGIIDAYDNIVVKIENELPCKDWYTSEIYSISQSGGLVEWKGGKKTQLYNIE